MAARRDNSAIRVPREKTDVTLATATHVVLFRQNGYCARARAFSSYDDALAAIKAAASDHQMRGYTTEIITLQKD